MGNVYVSSDRRGLVLSIPQGMTGRQLAAWKAKNQEALTSMRSEAKQGNHVCAVIETSEPASLTDEPCKPMHP
jgi:hypothetical protein